MTHDKQTLLKRHRRHKRLLGLSVLIAGVVVAFSAGWLWGAGLLLTTWIAHEAWGSDHLFYSPSWDYTYQFEANFCGTVRVDEDTGCVQFPVTGNRSTYVLGVKVSSSLLGCLRDPHLWIGEQRFDFERHASGWRYLLLGELTEASLPFARHHCRFKDELKLFAFPAALQGKEKLLVIAPHADDAELAAFGLYQAHSDSMIVTLTQGEAEAENYQKLGLTAQEAAEVKGRLRSWDSQFIPAWGGIPPQRCIQLGYPCLQLTPMSHFPDTPVLSPYTQTGDTRPVRQWNALRLPSDANGLMTWENLLLDLRALLENFQPDVVVFPHPTLDPHPDHQAAAKAVQQVLRSTRHQPRVLLNYANHLHDNDRWPMGPVGQGTTLPPCFDLTNPLSQQTVFSWPLDRSIQIDKSLALGMQHDLQGRLPFKKKIRRFLQATLAGRRWPTSGDSEFFRKAVRQHEIFWVSSAPSHKESN